MAATFASRLAASRRRAGLTQAVLARDADCTQSNIAHMERGRSKGSVDTVRRIAKRLGLRSEWLVTGRPPRFVRGGCR
jgi:transcriptional regulator with XRE-family HTH domain